MLSLIFFFPNAGQNVVESFKCHSVVRRRKSLLHRKTTIIKVNYILLFSQFLPRLQSSVISLTTATTLCAFIDRAAGTKE